LILFQLVISCGEGGTKYQARGLLMIEHRLIERMLSIIKIVLVQIEAKKKISLPVGQIVFGLCR
jgi:hypothetical protein